MTQLSYVNETSRPPLQISPTIFSTVLQIRTLVDEATHLAVRAHNPLSGPHGTGKISRERQFRMYELAVEKLARAYALDEVAASVASMQSASAVEEVAGKVLERAKARGEEPSRDARYVYFFCEKIPSRYVVPPRQKYLWSRMLSESTSLIPLTELHQELPSSPHYLRTRAITRSLKGDFLPAIKDLTAALSLVKALAEHQSQSDANGKGKQTSKGSDLSPDMESQCVFQRGGCYLTLAIRHAGRLTKVIQKMIPQRGSEEFMQTESDIRSLRLYARKAERDFLRFLSKVDYSPDVDREEGAVVVTLNTLFTHDEENPSEPIHTDLVVVQASNGDQGEVPEAALTYHPLLPDALYSLLLAHTLTLTPPQTPTSTSSECSEKEKAELIRWARIVARLQSICDGYPLFLPARSPYFSPPLELRPNISARADWIELLRMSGQKLLSVPNWEAILSSLPRPSTQRKSPLPSMRELSLSTKPEPPSGTLSKSDYPITTERAGIVSRFVEDIVFGKVVAWDLSVAHEETKGKKKKGKK